MSTTYLDYAATTPVDPEVARAMTQCLQADGDFGNPASTHAFGRRAAARVDRARMQVASLISASPDEIVWTSGATESNNLALLGIARANADRGRHLVTSRIEHKAVLDPCRRLEKEGFSVTYLNPDQSGRIAPQSVRAALRGDTVLVSIMMANNEIGVLQDLVSIGAICRERGVVLHTDAAQAVGKVPVNVAELPVDFLSCTAHKLYGPKGIGALYVRGSARALIQPILFGGGQERGLRAGTLATHQIVGFGLACEIAKAREPAEGERLCGLREDLWKGLASLQGIHLNGAAAPRVPTILNVSIEGVEGESLVTGLAEVALSTGSACNSASAEPSYVLRALGRDSQLSQSSLRVSLGRFTTADDVDLAVRAIHREVRRLRAASPHNRFGLRAPNEVAESSAAFENGGNVAASGCSAPERPASDRAASERSAAAASTESDSKSSPAGDALSPTIRRYFLGLPRGGRLPERGSSESAVGAPASDTAVSSNVDRTFILSGEAGGPGEEVWVRFHLLIDEDTVKDARFQAYGCPHTLGTAAWLTGQLVGRRVSPATSEWIPGGPREWARTLGVPTEKLGRLLALEDALRACVRDRRIRA